MRLRILGSGDAFGSGGRLQTAFLLDHDGESRTLVDCGATALVGLRKAGEDPDRIEEVLVTHLHGDHFGGLPFLILHLHYVAGRRRPLRIIGPPGIEARLQLAMSAFFPGSAELGVDFPLDFVEITRDHPVDVEVGRVIAFEANHPSGAPSHGLRVESEVVVAFSGDTQWTDELPTLARGAHLFVCECYGLRSGVPHHLDLETLTERREQLDCGRIVLTHLGQEAHDHAEAFAEAGFEIAEDGQEIIVRG